MKRNLQYIPDINGIYGIRIWVPTTDQELLAFLKPICLWGGPTNSRLVDDTQEVLYELPLGTAKNPLWKKACSYFNIELVEIQ